MTEESKKIRQHVGRLAVPILLVVFYVWYGSLILELPQGPGEEGPLGPSFIPWLWASLLILLTLVEIATGNLGARRDNERVVIERKGVLDALILCLLLAGFAVLMQYAGFTAAVIAFLAVSIWWSGIRSWKIIIPYVVIFALVVNYVFHHILKVPLRRTGSSKDGPPGGRHRSGACVEAFSVRNPGKLHGNHIRGHSGLTVSMGIILLLPFTFHMASVTSMSLLVGVFRRRDDGGSISAILLNIPGNPAAIVTSLDGHPLARKGRAGVALAWLFLELSGRAVQPRLPGDHSTPVGGFRAQVRRARTGLAGVAGPLPHLRVRPDLDEQGAHLGRAGPEFRHRRDGPYRFDTALHVRRGADSAGGLFPACDDRPFRGARDHLRHARLRRLAAGFLDAPARPAALAGHPGRPLEDARAILPHRDHHRPAAGHGERRRRRAELQHGAAPLD